LGKLFDWNILIIRISPYPPSFSRIAAKIIEPAIGASTWALGSHRCVVNIGSFTSIPTIRRNHSRFEDIHDGTVVGMSINDEDVEFHIYINIINIGNDAVMVYIIKYIPACIRSGWYPQYMMIRSVGMREASNQI